MSEGDKLFDDPDGLAGGDSTGIDTSAQSSSSLPIDPTQSRHKVACFFHVFFKGAALALYLCYVLLFNSFITGFICCVLLLAFDFWTVKNVTGRLLVGLRWWNEVKEDGTNVWVFESKPDTRQVNPNDSFIFWSALYLTPLVWVLLGMGAVFTLSVQPLLIVAVALMLSGANIVGYWKCQKDAGRRIQSFTQNWLINRMTQQATGTTPASGQ